MGNGFHRLFRQSVQRQVVRVEHALTAIGTVLRALLPPAGGTGPSVDGHGEAES